jgi:outer membrane protein, multidrug efflux system
MMKHTAGNRPRSALLACALFLAGCQTVGPDYAAPAVGNLPDVFPSASTPRVVGADKVIDVELASLMRDGLAANQTLAEAVARVRESRAIERETGAVQRPGAVLDADASARRTPRVNSGFPGAPETDEFSVSASVRTQWEIDLFGRAARQRESAAADTAALAANRDDLARLIAADIALAYLDLREAEVRGEVGARNLITQRRTLEVTQTLLEYGRASRLDVARIDAQVAATGARLPQLAAAATAARNRLTTLLNRPPGSLDARLSTSSGLPRLALSQAAGSPANLLRLRPDVRAAELSLAAETARIGVASAELYPSISLAGSAGLSGLNAAEFLSGDRLSLSAGPVLRWNIFDRAAIFARIEQADARTAARLARFRQTLNRALEEVDTGFSNFAQETERLARLNAARAASSEAERLARVRYEAGREPLLTVLDAERVLLAAEDDAVRSEAALVRAQIELFRALALSWDLGGEAAATPNPEPQP